MSEIQLAHFSFGGDGYARSRTHEIAIHEARIATEHREEGAGSPETRSLFARLGLPRRLRFAVGAPVVETCSCPA